MSETDEENPQPEVSSKPPIEAKIRDWLDTQGTILELTVASKFLAVLGPNTYAHNVYHARHYRERDPLTLEDKFREIDVVVQATPIFTQTTHLTLLLILECKSKKNFPWVFYRSSEHTDDFTDYEDAFVVMRNRDFSSRAIVGLRDISIFNIQGIPYSTSGAAALTKEADKLKGDSRNGGGDFRNGVRDSILQVLSATDGISKEVGLNSKRLMAAILVPIVVTKAPMFTVTLDDSGAPKIESTFRELVVTRSKLDAESLKYVWVIHESQIDDICSEFAASLPRISLNL
jgi:hypothetical protein